MGHQPPIFECVARTDAAGPVHALAFPDVFRVASLHCMHAAPLTWTAMCGFVEQQGKCLLICSALSPQKLPPPTRGPWGTYMLY